jgi:hypothetical protein
VRRRGLMARWEWVIANISLVGKIVMSIFYVDNLTVGNVEVDNFIFDILTVGNVEVDRKT